MVETREERGWQAADNNVNLLGGEENKEGNCRGGSGRWS